MRIDTRPRKRNAPRPKEKSAPQFLQWLRGRPCACGGRNPDCEGKMEAAHGPDKATKGMGTKCADRNAMPLSEACHRLQHSIGWPPFAAKFLPGPALDVCAEYWRQWPGRIAWERKLND